MFETVARRMNDLVERFQENNPSWNSKNVTVVGHSLGEAHADFKIAASMF